MSDIELKPLSNSDPNIFEDLYKIRFSDFVHRYFGGTKPSLESHLEWMHSAVQSKQYYGFSIQLDEVVLGGCSLKHVSDLNRNAEFDIYLSKSTTGHGYGRIALAKLIQFGFSELNLHRIYAYLIESNMGALHMYKKLGFEQEGIMRDHVLKNGTFQNSIIIGLLQKDYEGSH